MDQGALVPDHYNYYKDRLSESSASQIPVRWFSTNSRSAKALDEILTSPVRRLII